MGSHSVNIDSTIIKNSIDKNGNIIAVYDDHKYLSPDKKQPAGPGAIKSEHGHDHIIIQPDYEAVKMALKNNEGCQVFGNLSVLKVPGNFHISSHAYAQIIGKLATEGFYSFDLSHTINHISFGDEDDIKKIKSTFKTGILNPIDNTVTRGNSKDKSIFEYYLKVVPTTYIDVDGNKYDVHQFTSNSNEVKANMMVPAIFFRYDISPILVKFVQTRERIFQFFIEICAIIGGIYMVASVILTFIINSSNFFFKNKEK